MTFNSAHQIAGCLRPFADRGPDIRIRLRDNGSTDTKTPGVLKQLAADGLIDELILVPEDPGFAVAANDVISRSGDDDILLINPDARFTLEGIAALRAAVATEPDLGLVTPLVYGGDEISVISAGRQPRLWPLFTHYSGLSRLFPTSALLRGRHLFLSRHADEDQYVEWSSGCVMLMPRTTIDKVGVFTERYFLYADDTEYCQRVLDAGLKIKVLAGVRAFHEVGGSGQDVPVSEEQPDAAAPEDIPAVEPPSTTTPAEPIDISTMWGRHLYDYYVRQFQPRALTRLAWRTTFTAGLAARALVRGARHPGDAKARHLMKNALAVWRV
ncbi:glycosyltransferase family 2 protein [Nocardia crassostreae]|uniref:glycosyltransferase family 2 protein n=1 Tax=Nocardia crassostreae TaxID=53428 RepID=UPI0014717296|nr:glycosyltransferase family 2 protein [Nocardia crassostreae]